jgi:predicted RNA methylase
VDRDRYDTPEVIATAMAAAVGRVMPTAVLDSACGKGFLLEAGSRAFPNAKIVGIERDGRVLRGVKVRNPEWRLFHGDSLNEELWTTNKIDAITKESGIALLNPPFSAGPCRRLSVTALGESVDCSLAMAHLLTTLSLATPSLVISILPESLLHSDGDRSARKLLESEFEMQVLSQLKNSLFIGARPNCSLVRIKKKRTVESLLAKKRSGKYVGEGVRIIRGGLPVFEARNSSAGLAYLHSTDLGVVAAFGPNHLNRKVKAIGRGIVGGYAVLLPRVGLPSAPNIKAILFEDLTQLSDCVIALTAPSKQAAEVVCIELRMGIRSLCAIYRGTGARFVTLSRLSEWLRKRGFQINEV